MTTERDMLNHICKTTEMGQYGITTVLGRTKNPQLRQVLRQSRAEYGEIYNQAEGLLRSNGAKPKQVPATAKLMTRMSTGIKTMADPSNSKIAEMMIQGDTMGVVKGLRCLRTYDRRSEQVTGLTQRLVDAEQDNIQRMKRFL